MQEREELKYKVLRTDKADSQITAIILSIAKSFGREVALASLEKLEKQIDALSQTPEIGIVPADSFLRRNGFRVLITEKDLVFYKVNKEEMTVTVYAVTDQRQDYISIVSG